jgi:OTU domain-containing protein 6
MADAESESLDDMEARHKRELRELEGKVRAMLKTAKKAEKAVVEAQTIQMQYDLKAKHNDELDALSERLGGKWGYSMADTRRHLLSSCFIPVGLLGLDVSSTEPVKVASGPDPEEEKRREEELAAAKKAKAQKKRDKKTQKESERELKKEEIDANAGPSMREMELSRLKELLAKQSLTIKEIPSDGHCLYR